MKENCHDAHVSYQHQEVKTESLLYIVVSLNHAHCMIILHDISSYNISIKGVLNDHMTYSLGCYFAKHIYYAHCFILVSLVIVKFYFI